MLSAETLRPSDLNDRQLEAWKAMAAATPAFRSPLLAPEFAQAVGRARRDAAVAVFQRDGRTVGFLAHHRAWGGYARPIGAPFSDYHALITAPGEGIEVAEALAAARLQRFRFSSVADPAGAFRPSAQKQHEGWAVDLAGRTPEQYVEALRSRNPRNVRQWRQLANKIERELGEIEFTAGDSSREAYDAMMGWKSAQLRRSGLHDVLQPRWVRTLMDDLFARQGEEFGGLLLTLRAGGRLLAADFGFRGNGVFHQWITAYDPEHAPYGPGRILLTRALASLPSLGLDVLDLGPTTTRLKQSVVLEPKTVFAGVAHGHPRAASPWRSVEGLLGPARGALVRKVQSRLDHIAAVEPSTLGRVRGILGALAAAPRRLGAAPGTAEA
jgi:CelD/BcsL family acetyltransferase involved in cellulose biosynthesis